MKKKLLYSVPIFLILLTVISITSAQPPEDTTVYETYVTTYVTATIGDPFPSENPNLEWKVAVGDVKTFTFTKLYDLNDYDGDGDPYTQSSFIELENGTEIDLKIRAGSTYSFEVLTLDEYATLQATIDGYELGPMDSGSGIVAKTVDNQTYWEEYATQISGGYQNVSVEGNLLVYQMRDTWNFGETQESIRKMNWKTGWLSYMYQKETNETHTISEMEIMTEGAATLTPGFELSPLPISLLLFSIYILKRRRKNDRLR